MRTNGVVQVNGANLSYETKGEGRPLVLLHDGLLDRRVWDYQVEAFTQEFRVVRYDRRGYGGSAAPRKRFSDVEDLHCLLGHLGISKVWLMGASNGGRIAVDFALEHPEKVDALVLVGPALSGYGTSEERHRKVSKMFSAARTEGSTWEQLLPVNLPSLLGPLSGPDSCANQARPRL